MAQYLPHVMQNLFNQPLAIAPSTAHMIVSALSGRLDIRALEDMSMQMDERAMADLAAMGRMEVEARAAKPKAAAPVAQVVETDYRPYRLTPSGIAILPVQGSLVRTWGVGPFSGSTGYDGIWTQMLHAEENPDVRAMWFDHNSGGGVVDGLWDLADAIYATSARFGGKPKWGMAADFSASASYALLAACDVVHMPKLGQVGSIGCLVMHADISRKLDKDGIDVTIVRAPEGKAKGNSVEPLDDETLADLYETVSEHNDHFVERLTVYRPGLTKKAVSETNGKVYTGARAMATGLVDDVLSEPAAWMKLEQMIAQR